MEQKNDNENVIRSEPEDRNDGPPPMAANSDDANNPSAYSGEIGLDKFPDSAFITGRELCQALGRSERTLQRMVARFEIPPPVIIGKRTVWVAGKVKAWIADALAKKEAEAIREAKRLRVFKS